MADKATDFQNVANTLRDVMATIADDDANLKAVFDFWNKNQADSYWAGLAGGDVIGDSGITKDQFTSAITFFENWTDFLDNVAPVQGDYRATIEAVRTTR